MYLVACVNIHKLCTFFRLFLPYQSNDRTIADTAVVYYTYTQLTQLIDFPGKLLYKQGCLIKILLGSVNVNKSLEFTRPWNSETTHS